MKHAYLIIAHKESVVLEKLLELLDKKDNDIYIHVDARRKNLILKSMRDYWRTLKLCSQKELKCIGVIILK